MKKKNEQRKNIKYIIFVLIGVVILFLGYIFIYLYQAHHPKQLSKNEPFCLRKTPYKIDPKLDRVLQLINERTGKRNVVDGGINDVINCLNINYNPRLSDSDLMGYFSDLLSTRDQLLIYLDPKLEFEDDLLTAIALSHELSHVSIFIKSNYYADSTNISCLDNEAIAYMHEDLFFRLGLNSPEQQHLIQLIKKSKDADLFLQATDIIFSLGENVLQSCKQTVKTDTEYNECYTQTFIAEIKQKIAPFYKKQCKL